MMPNTSLVVAAIALFLMTVALLIFWQIRRQSRDTPETDKRRKSVKKFYGGDPSRAERARANFQTDANETMIRDGSPKNGLAQMVEVETSVSEIFNAMFDTVPGEDLKGRFAAFFSMVQEAEDTSWGPDTKDREFLEDLISVILKKGYQPGDFLSALLCKTEYCLRDVLEALPQENRPKASELGRIIKISGIDLSDRDELESLLDTDDLDWEEMAFVLKEYGFNAEQTLSAWLDRNYEDLSEEIEWLHKAGYDYAETLLAVNSTTQDYSTAELVQAAYELKLPDEDIAAFLKDPQANIMGSLDDFESELAQTDLPMPYRVNLMYRLLNP